MDIDLDVVSLMYDGHDFDFVCHPPGKDLYISMPIREHGIYDDQKTSLWYNHIQRGDLVIDVGANIGWFSKIATLKGASVISFEPDTVSYDIMVRNCPEAESYNLCAGNSTDDVGFWLNDCNNLGDNRVCLHGSIMKQQVPIDEIVKGRKISAIKIDTQGWEPMILAGARNTLANLDKGSMVIMEYWPYGMSLNGFGGEFLQQYIDMFTTTIYIHNDGSVRPISSLDFNRMSTDMDNFGDIIWYK